MLSSAWDGDWPITQPFNPQTHLGVDIGMPIGTALKAMCDGTVGIVGVGFLGFDTEFGYREFYGHIKQALVPVGTRLSKGQALAVSGVTTIDPRFPPTGPHLHFEVQLGTGVNGLMGVPPGLGNPGQPLDPIPILEGLDVNTLEALGHAFGVLNPDGSVKASLPDYLGFTNNEVRLEQATVQAIKAELDDIRAHPAVQADPALMALVQRIDGHFTGR